MSPFTLFVLHTSISPLPLFFVCPSLCVPPSPSLFLYLPVVRYLYSCDLPVIHSYVCYDTSAPANLLPMYLRTFGCEGDGRDKVAQREGCRDIHRSQQRKSTSVICRKLSVERTTQQKTQTREIEDGSRQQTAVSSIAA